LFLHGFPEYWGVWKKIMKELSTEYQVIAPDMRGFNLSSRPTQLEHYSIEHLVGDVRALADHLGLRKLTLVTQDWGALVGWNFAIRHPEYVRRFVTINVTHPALLHRELRENPKQQQASQYMLFFRTPLSTRHFSANDFAIPKQTVFEDALKHGASLSEEDIAEWLQAWRQQGDMDAGLNYYRATNLGPPDNQGHPGGSNVLDGVPEEKWKVNLPVLVLWAEEDPYFTDDGLRGLEQLVPDLTLRRVPGATHWLTLEKPELTAQSIRDFIAQKG
jgi:pimeloyl-ACP methyl ester carboxylesterase